MTINSFDRDNLDTIGSDIMTALQAVGRKHGIDFGRKGIRYTEGDFRMTLTAVVADRPDGVLTAQEKNYIANTQFMDNFPKLGDSYNQNGIMVTIVGWNTRARKYPIMLKGSDGKGYKNSVEAVRFQSR